MPEAITRSLESKLRLESLSINVDFYGGGFYFSTDVKDIREVSSILNVADPRGVLMEAFYSKNR